MRILDEYLVRIFPKYVINIYSNNGLTTIQGYKFYTGFVTSFLPVWYGMSFDIPPNASSLALSAPSILSFEENKKYE